MVPCDPVHDRPLNDRSLAEAPLMLPCAGFFADEALGAGHVQLPDDFYALDHGRQLGILADWRVGVERQWRRALVQAFRQAGDISPTLPLPERIEQFRRQCANQRIELPADFALALQQF